MERVQVHGILRFLAVPAVMETVESFVQLAWVRMGAMELSFA